MNKTAINERIKNRHLNLSSWCLAKELSYSATYQMLNSNAKRLMETRTQVKIIDALIAEGLYVPEVDEGVSVSEQQRNGTEG